MPQQTNSSIYIVGDNIIDHHLYIKQQDGFDYPTLLQMSKNGGAHLIFNLLNRFKSKRVAFGNKKPLLENYDIKFGHKLESRRIEEDELFRYETGLLWEPYRLTNNKSRPEYKIFHWRISNKLGYGHTFRNNRRIKRFVLDDAITPNKDDILVIDDGGLEFRKQEEFYKKLLQNNWKYILLKISNPVGAGSLFHELIKNHSEKLIIVTTANELRQSNVRISKGVSWEQSISDLILELNQNKQIKDLKKCKSLIVTFSTEGAFYIDNAKTGEDEITKYRLLFDNKYLEGEFINEEISGEMFGFQSTFTTAILLGLISYDTKPGKNRDALETMINNGLSATRILAINGHGNIKERIPGYPFEKIFKNFVDPDHRYGFAFAPQPDPEDSSGPENWSILKGNYDLENLTEPLYDEALSHILKRKTGLINTPQYSVNHFFTVDRKEIEGLRNIKQLLLAYDRDKGDNKPLSIAVFGSPGSGKSFVVKQLEKGIHIPYTSFLEFNLSQFSNPEDIIGALHQVRDEVLNGNLPFVFWDEFDSKEYMWLQYLLAPMQDGKFQEGQITHSIGRCVFIFAGGTSYDFHHFGHAEPMKPVFSDDADIEVYKLKVAEYNEKYRKYENFKLKKGPDFKSRLSGHLNIMGPNQEYAYNEKTEKWDIPNDSDVYYPIRRAILFNALSGFDASKNEVDHSLLNAIIKVSKYKHGARSFEKIIKSIFQDSDGKMLRSNLPPDTLLAAHVDKLEFENLLASANKLELTAARIAEEVHNSWKALGDEEGWKLEYHRDYNYLPTHIKKENVAAVLRIPGILEAAGYSITDNPSENHNGQFEEELSKKPELLEKLARIEHEGWSRFKTDNGWKNNKKRNDDKRLHNCIVPFDQLSDKDQNKDKDSVLRIPDVLGKAGLFVKKV
jgi:hypothetical protein